MSLPALIFAFAAGIVFAAIFAAWWERK